MRGEYRALLRCGPRGWELPPRARRILFDGFGAQRCVGTTSACAENTPRGWGSRQPSQELPPRARRIPTDRGGGADRSGTTSACAENTVGDRPRPIKTGNYLRVRGEYWAFANFDVMAPELPPRARRIHPHAHFFGAEPGTTSACAENTTYSPSLSWRGWNYLRVRGEYRLPLSGRP